MRPPGRRRSRRTGVAGLAAVCLGLSLVAAGCDAGVATPTPFHTAIPLRPTAWPQGTVGQYGLRIDPTLLADLPFAVSGNTIEEDAQTEIGSMDDPNLPKTFDSYAAGMINEIGASVWLSLAVGHRKSLDPDVYQAWVDSWAALACSQASGVQSAGQETIGNWLVDTATCNGKVNVYTLAWSNDRILSMFGAGSGDLGRLLIEHLN
jgi:hypothetical protein